jgi:basic membrane protein A
MRPLQGLVAILAAAAAAAVAVAVTGCGGDEASTTQPEAAVKVALVADAGQLNDNAFTELAYKGLTRAEAELGIESRVVQANSAVDYVPNMSTLARQGYDLIIAAGYAQGDAIAKVAAKYPDTSFAIVDVDQASLEGAHPNLRGLLFREEQVGYLAGTIAALAKKRAGGPQVVSAVGGYKEPPVDRFIAGYQAGAEAAVPGTKVIWSYSSDWEDLAKCKELALNQIAAGSGVVFQVAGGCGLGALNAAKTKGVWGIGVDADQSFLGPHVLTSALKGVDQAVYSTIQDVIDARFQGGRNVIYGLAEDGVGLGTFSPNASQEDIDAVAEVEAKIAAGEIEVPTQLIARSS